MRSHRRHVVYPTIGAVLLVAAGFLATGGLQRAVAQTAVSEPNAEAPAVQWRLVLDGERAAWPDTVSTASVDRLQTVGRRVLRHLRRKGYYYATLDSATVDTSAPPGSARLHVRRGPQVRIGALRIEGDSAVPADELRALMDTDEGEPLRPDRLEADIQALLDRYEEAGRPLAQIRMAETRLSKEGPPTLRVTLRVREGPELWLKRIDVPDDSRTTPELLAHLAGLEVGAPLRNYDPEAIRRWLQEHAIFQSVDAPRLRVAADGGAVLRIPVEEASPGAFDFVVGYLPPSQTRDSGQLVGSGHLLLKHLFGGGRRAEFTLDRRPGPAGSQFLDNRQQIPRSTTLFYGLGVRYRRLDRPQNPRRGLSVDIQFARGRKARRLRRITANGDTTRVSDAFRQERLQGRIRTYLPLFDRQVLAVGGEGSVLLSRDFDRSDLFRLGGATSLRGYDEDRFLGNVVARGLVEYRLQLDRASYAHAFFDLGYVARPALEATTATWGWHPGYGLGVRLQTAIGRMSATYALNPTVQSPANGRVHLGLSVGL